MAKRKLEIIIAGDAQGAVAAFNRTEKATQGAERGLGTLKKAAVGLGAAMVAKQLVSDAFEGMKRTEAASAQLESGLRSTSNAANTTVTGMASLATAMERTTGVEAELVMEGQALLQTFTNVRNEAGANNDVFNRATQAAIDLSYKGFGSVTDASKMLGKALNDPIKGISAMSRAGVTFSEDQKKMITSLVETGDQLGAQKIILNEVEKQVGGAAAAYGETLPGKIDRANAAIGEITENLLASAAPALETVAEAVMSLGVEMGLLNSVDITLPDKLMTQGLDAAGGVDHLAKSVANLVRFEDPVQQFFFGWGSGTRDQRKEIDELDYGLSQLATNGNAADVAEKFLQLKNAAAAYGVSVEELHRYFPQYVTATGELKAQVSGLSEAEQQATLDTDAWGVEMQDLDDKVKGLTTSFDYLLGRFLSTDEAQIRSRERTLALAEAVAGGARENESLSATNDRLTGSLIGVVNAADDEYTAMVRSGEASGAAGERNGFLRERLVDLRNEFPGLRGQIDEYIGRLDAVPSNVDTSIVIDAKIGKVDMSALSRGVSNFFGSMGDGPGKGGGKTLSRVQSVLGNIQGAYVTSTYRSPAANRAAGGAKNSYHMDRNNPAVDIGGRNLGQVAARLEALGGWREGPLWQVPGHYDHVHVAHGGGIVSPDWATAAGLRSDERPVIAQIGEGIVSRKQMAAAGGSRPVVNVNIYGFYGGEMGLRDLTRDIKKRLGGT